MIRAHWWFGLWTKPRKAADLFRSVNVAGGHASTLTRLVRIGPWSVYVVRYRPGHVDENGDAP